MASPCVACHEPLVFPNEDGVEVPDDLQLPCGCHFHWQVPLPFRFVWPMKHEATRSSKF